MKRNVTYTLEESEAQRKAVIDDFLGNKDNGVAAIARRTGLTQARVNKYLDNHFKSDGKENSKA